MINKIELGKNDIIQSKIAEIAAALDTTPEYLMGWQTEVSKRVNEDEAELVDGYRALPDESKQLIKSMVPQLSEVFRLSKILSSSVDKSNLFGLLILKICNI